MKAILIPIDGPPREVDLPGGGGTRFMRSLKALIGTRCAERIRVTSRWEAWLDEDGAAAGRSANQAATLVARSFGFEFSLLGPVVITGLGQGRVRTSLLVPGPGRRHPGEGQGTSELKSALSRRRCSMDARVSMSRASLREVAQATFGARAAGLRKLLNSPFTRVAVGRNQWTTARLRGNRWAHAIPSPATI